MPAPPSPLRGPIERLLAEASGVRAASAWHALGDGVGGSRWRVEIGDERWFVKTGDEAEVFAAEADGLRALAGCDAVAVPHVLHSGAAGTGAFIAMQWLDLHHATAASDALFGERLASLHLHRGAQFGWHRSNFIGATPQFNTPSRSWEGFFREHRLGFQLRLAAENGYRGRLQEQGARLLEGIAEFFRGYTPSPSLLHGDLWSGNRAVLAAGESVVFDPAVYHGDREADIAMTELFGGFAPEFLAAYRAHAPLEAGYGVRRGLYNLYHVLNHLNLFGEGYLDPASRLMGRLLAELG